MEIVKAKVRKDGVKYIIIPKCSKINSGDFVLITNNLNMINKFKEEEDGRKK